MHEWTWLNGYKSHLSESQRNEKNYKVFFFIKTNIQIKSRFIFILLCSMQNSCSGCNTFEDTQYEGFVYIAWNVSYRYSLNWNRGYWDIWNFMKRLIVQKIKCFFLARSWITETDGRSLVAWLESFRTKNQRVALRLKSLSTKMKKVVVCSQEKVS